MSPSNLCEYVHRPPSGTDSTAAAAAAAAPTAPTASALAPALAPAVGRQLRGARGLLVVCHTESVRSCSCNPARRMQRRQMLYGK